MRYSQAALAAVFAALAAAFALVPVHGQDARLTTTYTYDLQGRRVPASTQGALSGAAGSSRSETVSSLNGTSIALESVDERIVSERPGSKVVERIVRKYDATGKPSGSEKHWIEESTADGVTSTTTTVHEADLNGRYTSRERSTTIAVKEGGTVRTETRTERPDLNGGFRADEKRIEVTASADGRSRTDVTVYRRLHGAGFSEAEREVTERTTSDGQSTTSVTQYNTAATGRMEMAGRRVSHVTKAADGGEMEVVDVFGSSSLREQQIIERKPGPGQSMTETFSVRRPELDSNRLGPAQRISETVCTGKCRP